MGGNDPRSTRPAALVSLGGHSKAAKINQPETNLFHQSWVGVWWEEKEVVVCCRMLSVFCKYLWLPLDNKK